MRKEIKELVPIKVIKRIIKKFGKGRFALPTNGLVSI